MSSPSSGVRVKRRHGGQKAFLLFLCFLFYNILLSCQVLFRDANQAVTSEDFTKWDAIGAYLALQKMRLLASRCSEDGETQENRDLKYNIFLLEGAVALPFHLWKPFLLLFFCLPAVNPESVSNFICAHFTQSLLISLKGDCLIFPFACFHF